MDIWIILIFINKSECSYSTSYNSILQENNTLLRKNCLYWNDQQNSCQCVCQVVIKVDDKYVTAKEKRSCEKKEKQIIFLQQNDCERHSPYEKI